MRYQSPIFTTTPAPFLPPPLHSPPYLTLVLKIVFTAAVLWTKQGLFKDSTMRLIPAFEASPKGYADLYQTVLVDTPIGPYFSQFLEQQQERLVNAAQVDQATFDNCCIHRICDLFYDIYWLYFSSFSSWHALLPVVHK